MDYHGNNEFNIKTLETSLLPHLLHIYKNEHVGIIERSICTIKERTRATRYTVPFKRYTSLMEISLIKGLVDFLNMFQ